MKILYFAKLKQLIGKSEDLIEINNKMRVIDVINELKNKNSIYFNAFEDTKNIQYAVNCEYVDNEYFVNNNDELALFPPVTGG